MAVTEQDDTAAWSLLIVDDDSPEAAALRSHLGDPPLVDPRVEHVRTVHDALDRVRRKAYDAVLLDLDLPSSDGLASFDALSLAAHRAAIIVLTGPDDMRTEQAIRRGGQDYVIKGDRRTGRIASTVFYAVRRQRVLGELEAARNAQLAEKDRFVSHVSHELRTPLTVAYQFGSMLADGFAGPLDDEQADMIGVLMRNLEQLNLLIDDLLEVGRVQRGGLAIRPVVFQPAEVVADTVAGFRPIATERGITLTYAGQRPGDVLADPRRLRQILGNLIENSLKFTPAGGLVEVITTPEVDAVRITVRDTGSGVRSADLPHIFEQFFQGQQRGRANSRGLGLGLYVCRQLVERQGGLITAESELGHGTTMSFTLPTDRRPAATERP